MSVSKIICLFVSTMARWLDKVGFWDIGPNRDGILFAPSPGSMIGDTNTNWVLGVASSALFAVAGFLIGKYKYSPSQQGYHTILESDINNL